jgi:hypothetical protein
VIDRHQELVLRDPDKAVAVLASVEVLLAKIFDTLT